MSVCVIIPCYNSEKYIKETLISIQEQSYTDLHIICINDGSKDSTLEILKKIKFKDDRIQIIDKQNGGIESSLKEAVKYIKSDYTFLIGHDDKLSKNAIENAVDKFNGRNEIDAVRMKLVLVNDKDEIISEINDQRDLSGLEALDNTIMEWKTHNFCLWKSKIFIKIKDITTNHTMNFDELATRYLYTYCNKVTYCTGEYYYFQNSNSVTHVIHPRLLDTFVIDVFIKKLLIDIDKYTKYNKEFEIYMFRRFKEAISLYLELKENNHSELNKHHLNKLRLIYKSINYREILNENASVFEKVKFYMLYNSFFLFKLKYKIK